MLNFVLDDDNMFVYMNELITKLLLLNLYAKFHICQYIVFLSKIDELWVVVVELCKNSWLIVVVDDWKTCCWWIGMLSMSLVNWWWKLLLLLNKFWKFWWIFEIETKIRFDSCVLSILVFMFEYMTYKLHLGRVLSVRGSKLENLGKRFLKFEVFFLNC